MRDLMITIIAFNLDHREIGNDTHCQHGDMLCPSIIESRCALKPYHRLLRSDTSSVITNTIL